MTGRCAILLMPGVDDDEMWWKTKDLKKVRFQLMSGGSGRKHIYQKLLSLKKLLGKIKKQKLNKIKIKRNKNWGAIRSFLWHGEHEREGPLHFLT